MRSSFSTTARAALLLVIASAMGAAMITTMGICPARSLPEFSAHAGPLLLYPLIALPVLSGLLSP